MKKTYLAGIALGLSAFALASCGEKASEPASEQAPDGVPGLVASNARLVLPPVEGNPAAVYFDLKYDGEGNIAIRSADVADAKSAMLHETIDMSGQKKMVEMLPLVMHPGETVKFEPGGKHVMAMGVSPDLKPGAKTEVTLTIAGGDKTSFPAEVKAAGDSR